MTGRFKQTLLEKGDMSGLTQKGGHKRSTKSGAGLTQKGVDAVNRKTGGNLKTAVTTPPSKLKPDSKPAKRRKSFCARSSGWTGERGKAARSRWNCSTDIVRGARLALAEACWKGYKAKGMKKKGAKVVPNCVKEEADPTKTTRASIKQGEGDANVYSKIKAKKDAASKPQAEKSKSVRRETLGRSGGMHDKKGTPANPSSNHPDYLKKKLYKRSTKDGGYGKEGKPTPADTEVNKQGVRGHEAKIAKKKAKGERQAKAQRISNKIRAMRGLAPLMPGEKHSSNDKLGDTEN